MNVILLGSTGYIGSEFARISMQRGHVITPLDYREVVQKERWFSDFDLVVNCAAYIPKPSVSLCDQNEVETVNGNVRLPFKLACICERKDVPLVHFSTACLFDENREYAESDKPLRGLKDHCGWYVGTKLMAEELPSLHIDNDWKKQAQEEKRRLAEAQEKQRAAQAKPSARPPPWRRRKDIATPSRSGRVRRQP